MRQLQPEAFWEIFLCRLGSVTSFDALVRVRTITAFDTQYALV